MGVREVDDRGSEVALGAWERGVEELGVEQGDDAGVLLGELNELFGVGCSG